MTIKTESYNELLGNLPTEGQHIVAQQTENEIVVYQAYKPAIKQKHWNKYNDNLNN